MDDTQIALRQALGWSRAFLLPPLAVALFLSSIDTLLTFRAIPSATGADTVIYYVPMLALVGPLLEVPAMLLMRRAGARGFIVAALLVAGLGAAGSALAASPMQFFICRAVGFAAQTVVVPAAAFLIAGWAPARTRTGMLSWLAAALALAPVLSALFWTIAAPQVSGPAAFGAIAAVWFAIAGWGWLVLADAPETARWLNPAQRAAMGWARSIERTERPGPGRIDLRLVILAMVALALAVSASAAVQWIGVLLRESPTPRGWFDLILAVIAALAVLAWAQAADRSGRVANAFTLACGLAAIGLAAAVLRGPMWQKTAGLVAHGAGLAVARCMTWSLAGRLAEPGRGAARFALIDAAGRVGLLAGPLGVVWLARVAGSLQAGMFGVVAVLVAAALGAAALRLVSRWE